MLIKQRVQQVVTIQARLAHQTRHAAHHHHNLSERIDADMRVAPADHAHRRTRDLHRLGRQRPAPLTRHTQPTTTLPAVPRIAIRLRRAHSTHSATRAESRPCTPRSETRNGGPVRRTEGHLQGRGGLMRERRSGISPRMGTRDAQMGPAPPSPSPSTGRVRCSCRAPGLASVVTRVSTLRARCTVGSVVEPTVHCALRTVPRVLRQYRQCSAAVLRGTRAAR